MIADKKLIVKKKQPFIFKTDYPVMHEFILLSQDN